MVRTCQVDESISGSIQDWIQTKAGVQVSLGPWNWPSMFATHQACRGLPGMSESLGLLCMWPEEVVILECLLWDHISLCCVDG